MRSHNYKEENDLYDMGKLVEQVSNIETKVDAISTKLDSNYLQKVEFDAKFDPISKIVYGLVMAVLTGLIGIALLFMTKK